MNKYVATAGAAAVGLIGIMGVAEAVSMPEATPTYVPPPVIEVNAEEKQEVKAQIAPKVEAKKYTPPASMGCCKICSKGKACGDSCISRSYQCHKGAGCACDG